MTICFFEISVQGRFFGWITFKLFDNECPKASKNFRLLCTGELTNKQGKKLHYKGTRLYRIIPQFIIQGGDVLFDDGTGGESALTDTMFFDEISPVKHNSAGLLCCANMGRPGTNASQFYITLCPCPWLDGRDTVFGKILSGHKCASALESFGSLSGSVAANVVISDCGTLIDPAALPGTDSTTGMFSNNPFRMAELHPHIRARAKKGLTRTATGRTAPVSRLSLNDDEEDEDDDDDDEGEEVEIDKEQASADQVPDENADEEEEEEGSELSNN